MKVNLHEVCPGIKINGAFKITSRIKHRHLASRWWNVGGKRVVILFMIISYKQTTCRTVKKSWDTWKISLFKKESRLLRVTTFTFWTKCLTFIKLRLNFLQSVITWRMHKFLWWELQLLLIGLPKRASFVESLLCSVQQLYEIWDHIQKKG